MALVVRRNPTYYGVAQDTAAPNPTNYLSSNVWQSTTVGQKRMFVANMAHFYVGPSGVPDTTRGSYEILDGILFGRYACFGTPPFAAGGKKHLTMEFPGGIPFGTSGYKGGGMRLNRTGTGGNGELTAVLSFTRQGNV